MHCAAAADGRAFMVFGSSKPPLITKFPGQDDERSNPTHVTAASANTDSANSTRCCDRAMFLKRYYRTQYERGQLIKLFLRFKILIRGVGVLYASLQPLV